MCTYFVRLKMSWKWKRILERTCVPWELNKSTTRTLHRQIGENDSYLFVFEKNFGFDSFYYAINAPRYSYIVHQTRSNGLTTIFMRRFRHLPFEKKKYPMLEIHKSKFFSTSFSIEERIAIDRTQRDQTVWRASSSCSFLSKKKLFTLEIHKPKIFPQFDSKFSVNSHRPYSTRSNGLTIISHMWCV